MYLITSIERFAAVVIYYWTKDLMTALHNKFRCKVLQRPHDLQQWMHLGIGVLCTLAAPNIVDRPFLIACLPAMPSASFTMLVLLVADRPYCPPHPPCYYPPPSSPYASHLLCSPLSASPALCLTIPSASLLPLRLQLGDVAGAEAMLDAALVYWRKQAVQPPASTSGATRGRGTAGASGADAAGTALGWCLQGLVGLKLRLGKVQEAVQCYQALQQSGAGGAGAGGGSQSAAVLGRLIRALAVQDAAGAVRMEAQLPGVSAAEVRWLGGAGE